jgi:hypothetical protein
MVTIPGGSAPIPFWVVYSSLCHLYSTPRSTLQCVYSSACRIGTRVSWRETELRVLAGWKRAAEIGAFVFGGYSRV